MIISAKEIAEAVKGTVISGDPEVKIAHIVTDSNTIAEQAIFVPIIGARVDGHRFIQGAFANGAAAAFTSEELSDETIAAAGSKPIIRVENTLDALQALGAYYRKTYVKIPYIGVTGSVGKTTTREMIACALSAGLDTYSTKGNQNSQTGVPITVTETLPSAKIGVIEMGMSMFGEMHRLSEVVQPDMAVMTVIGISHIGNLGTQENIRTEKLHILDGMKDGGTLLLNGDDPMLSVLTLSKIQSYGIAEGKQLNIKFYGTGENAFYRAENIRELGDRTEYELRIGSDIRLKVALSVPGVHMVLNSLAALACAYENGVSPAAAAAALESFTNLSGRGKTLEKNGVRVINDAYNAAPQSMMAGLKVLNSAKTEKGGKHIAVLADMLELGPEERRYHREVGAFLAAETPNIDAVYLYGTLAEEILKGITEGGSRIHTEHFMDYELLKKKLEEVVSAGDVVFFKGSNSMKLWKMAEELLNDPGEQSSK